MAEATQSFQCLVLCEEKNNTIKAYWLYMYSSQYWCSLQYRPLVPSHSSTCCQTRRSITSVKSDKCLWNIYRSAVKVLYVYMPVH